MSVFARHHRSVMAVLSVAVLLCLSSLHLFASTAVVTPPNTVACKTATTFNTISAAVTAVTAGSTIYICPGTYAEQVTITKKLTLIGLSGGGLTGVSATGANNPVIVPPNPMVVNAFSLSSGNPIAAQIVVMAPGSSVNISNLTVDGSGNGLSGCGTNLIGIYYQNSNGIVNHVVARYQELDVNDFGCQDGLAIFVQSGSVSGSASVTVENSSVHDYDKNGITANGNGTVATVTGNYVVGIGATPLIAQNGIQFGYGARGKISGNTVSDDVYINPPNCGAGCTNSTGILLYDSGGTIGSHVTISTNTVSNTQGGVIIAADGAQSADYNDVSTNKITTTSAAGSFLIDGIDLCSSNNTASGNTVFNSAGAGVHIDGECLEPGNIATGTNTMVTSNTVNEACAGVLTGPGTGGVTGNSVAGTVTYNVVQTIASGDICPAGISGKAKPRLHPAPQRD